MIQEIRKVGRTNDAPVLVLRLDVAKEWVALAYKNNLEYLSICFWSARDQARQSTSELMDEIAGEVAAAADELANDGSAVLFDLQYKQPAGWDRWLSGIPRPLRGFFDEVLHPKLKSLLETTR
jgi:hypothetical protein